jgi:DNA ligase-1
VSNATVIDFARVNDAVAATTKKLEKYALLAAYFGELEDEDLRRAVRYAGGRTFAMTDERVLAVGGAIVRDVVLRLLRIDPHLLYETAIASGEMGEALSKLWHHAPPLAVSHDSHRLTLADLSDAFDDLASTGNVRAKGEILTALFSRCIDGREAAYLAKIIFGDLRTGVQEGVLIDAISRGFGRPRADVQRAVLLIGDLGDVAVLAKHDRLADARFTLFHPIQFMLATAQEDAAEAARTMAGRAFVAEDKLDGIRAQVHKQGERIAIYTRTMDRTDESFPDVVEAIRALPGNFLLDGEIVPFRDGKVLPFAHIQKRLGRKVLTAKIIRDNPTAFIAFDILYRDGVILMDKPLRERRAALEALLQPCCASAEGLSVGATPAATSPGTQATSGATQPSPLLTNITAVANEGQIDRAFCLARDCRNEGLILKDPDSAYSPGRRGKAWLKLKTHLPTFDCVVTFAETGHGKRRGSLSDYTFAVWDRDPFEEGAQLVNVGKAYSGVTDAEIAQLTKLFTGITRHVHGGRVREVEPKVVLEIACDQIQKSARHASGYAMRFPRIKRIRWDKKPQEADQLARLIEVYHSPANFGRGDDPSAFEPPPDPTLFDGLM